MYKNHKRKLIQSQLGINVTGDNINVIAVHSRSAEGQCGASFKEAILKAYDVKISCFSLRDAACQFQT